MVDIQDKDGIIILYGDDFNLKIDNNRKIYYKKKDSISYKSCNVDIDTGYSLEEKKIYLKKLYEALNQRFKEEIAQKENINNNN